MAAVAWQAASNRGWRTTKSGCEYGDEVDQAATSMHDFLVKIS
jgi:hypothetical protein